MLYLKRHFKPRVPNSLAVLAAVMLAASSFFGAGGNTNPEAGVQTLAADHPVGRDDWIAHQAEAGEVAVTEPSRRHARFMVNLFLFRHN